MSINIGNYQFLQGLGWRIETLTSSISNDTDRKSGGETTKADSKPGTEL